tara:strand:+ start:423 stop:872 length:450 start_codon:yes stop_codon:yes gene_type:complete
MTETIRIQNINNYIQEIIDGDLILTPKKVYISENEINKINIKKSKIQECIIKNNNVTISTKTNYRSILNDIWKTIPTQKILQHTTFNMKLTNENGEKGYNWNSDINISFQGKDSNGTMKEIINMVKLNNYSLNISIKLETNEVINFKIE